MSLAPFFFFFLHYRGTVYIPNYSLSLPFPLEPGIVLDICLFVLSSTIVVAEM